MHEAANCSIGGQRRHAAGHPDRVTFLLWLHATGMSIADMQHLAQLR